MTDQPENPIAALKVPTNIADEMRQSYMDYAMSVIIGRALPDVRDGLKPANRRVLFTMHEMGLQPGRGYRKCAGIVGDVMGKYHPHGDVRDLRHPGAHGPGLQPARHAGGRPGQLRLRGRRPPRGHALHRGPPDPPRRHHHAGHRQGDRRLPAELRRPAGGAYRAAHRAPQPARERSHRHRRGHGDQHPAPQPGRGGGRAHLPARQPGPAHARRAARGADAAHPRPRLPHRGLHRGQGRHSPGLPDGPRLHRDAGPGRDRGHGRATRNPSSSPRSPTSSTRPS